MSSTSMQNAPHASRAQTALDESRRRAEASRAARSVDRATRRTKKQGKGRLPKAPKSASQFHLHTKFSNRAGKNQAPKSAVGKIKYDFEMDLKNAEKSRLDYTYVSAPLDTPKMAFDAIAMAQACEKSMPRKANLNASLMAHTEISLPKELNVMRRIDLIHSIADYYCNEMKVPIYVAAHKPDYGNDNWHIHISHPMRYVRATGDDGFALGDRIIQYQRPEVRAAQGLPKSWHEDLRKRRKAIADLIADAMIRARLDKHLAERWRHGSLRLYQQVEKAIERGDLEFVADNALRDPTKKEGLNYSRWQHRPHSDQRRDAEQHNTAAHNGNIGAAMLTRTLLNRVLSQAERAGLNAPEHIRMLARDMGLAIEWTRTNRAAVVSGMRVQMLAGPKLSGREVGITLYDLKRRFGWEDVPTYRRYAAKDGEDFMQYARAVQGANIGVVPGQTMDTTTATIKAALRGFERQQEHVINAQSPKEVTAVPTATVATKENRPPAKGAKRPTWVKESNARLPDTAIRHPHAMPTKAEEFIQSYTTYKRPRY